MTKNTSKIGEYTAAKVWFIVGVGVGATLSEFRIYPPSPWETLFFILGLVWVILIVSMGVKWVREFLNEQDESNSNKQVEK